MYVLTEQPRLNITYKIIQEGFFAPTAKTTNNARAITTKLIRGGFLTSKKLKGSKYIAFTLTPLSISLIRLIHANAVNEITLIEKVSGSPLNMVNYEGVALD